MVNKAKIFRCLMEEGGASRPALVQQGIGGKVVEQGYDEPVALDKQRPQRSVSMGVALMGVAVYLPVPAT